MFIKHIRSITATRMRYLGKSIRKTRKHRIRNVLTRKDLEQLPVKKIIERKGLRWFGHAVRMSEQRKPKHILRV